MQDIQMTLHYFTAILHTTLTHNLVTNHQCPANNGMFVLSKKTVENRQSTNLCKSNLSVKGRRKLKP